MHQTNHNPETHDDGGDHYVLSDERAMTILNNVAVMLNHLANIATNAVDTARPDVADRVFADSVRNATPDKPARAHPLSALSIFVARCAKQIMQIFAITKPHLFAKAESMKAKARAEARKIKMPVVPAGVAMPAAS